MALAVDTTSHATATGSGASLTWAHTCGASANKLVVTVGIGAGASRAGASCTYNGDALSLTANADDGGFERAEIWEINTPDTGSAFNIVFTAGGAGQELAAGAISFSGAHATDGAPSSNTGTSANPSVTVVDTASGDIVVSMYASDIGPTGTTTEAGTLIWEDEDVGADSDYNSQRQNAVGASTVCSWTAVGGFDGAWAVVGIAIKAAAEVGGGGGTGLEESGFYSSEPQTNPMVVSTW